MDFKLIQKSEYDKVLTYDGSWLLKMQLFSTMCRYNTLVAVKKAGSGHLGSSLSALDISTFLYLNELNTLKEYIKSGSAAYLTPSAINTYLNCENHSQRAYLYHSSSGTLIDENCS